MEHKTPPAGKNKLRFSQLFTIFCFMVFLLGAMAVTVLREPETYSYFENRSLKSLPDVTSETIYDGTFFTELETFLQDHAAARNTLLKLGTFIDLNLLCRPVVNDTVVLEELLLPFNDYEVVDNKDIAERADTVTQNLLSVNNLVKSYGGKYYYAAVPCQYVSWAEYYPRYMNNRSEFISAQLSALTESLKSAGISFIDTGYLYDDPAALSSRVDNHYSMQGAWVAYREIMETINSDLGLDLVILDETNSTTKALPNPYMGDKLRRLFNLSPSDEKLSVMLPDEPVSFTRYDNGSLSQSYIYALPSDDYSYINQTLYMGGDKGNTVIDTNRNELPSVLIYGDSFTNAVEALLYYSFDEMHSLDLRYYSGSSLGEYIETYKPDIVICLRNYSALIDPTDNGKGIN